MNLYDYMKLPQSYSTISSSDENCKLYYDLEYYNAKYSITIDKDDRGFYEINIGANTSSSTDNSDRRTVYITRRLIREV